MNQITRRAAVAALLVGSVFVGVGCGGGGAADRTPAQTGQVSVAVTDAPLSQLQSFTLEVSRVTLKGAGGPDAIVFPAPGGGASSVTIDLLALQGLNQLLANANVLTGTYYGIEIEYANPQATDINGIAQTVQHAGNAILGLFQPPLMVTQGSQQSIQIDLDLQHSVIDLGGSNVFLAPAVVARVLGQGQAIPLQRLHGIVRAIDVQSDRFELEVRHAGGHLPGGGRIPVQCDAQTTYNDANGTITTGNVPASLTAGDLVAVDGFLAAGGGIDADAVTAVPGGPFAGGHTGGNTGGGPTGGGQGGQTGQHHFVHIAGTIMDFPATNSVTIRVAQAFGPAGNQPHAPFSDVTLTTDARTQVHRGPTLLAGLAALTRGNFCFAVAEQVANGGLVARDLDENPSGISGTIHSVTANGNQGVTVDFAPSQVNQIPVAQMPFVPSPLTVDLPGFFQGQAGDPFQVFAFFDGSSHLTFHGFGGHVGATPPNPPGTVPVAGLAGVVQQGTTATVNSNGDIEFTLQIGGPSGPSVAVVVDQSAHMVAIDPFTGPMQLTVSSAVTTLNASPALVEVEGSAGPTGTFLADVALRILVAPRPNTGGGNTGGGGFPGGGGTGTGGGNTGGGNTGGGNTGGTLPPSFAVLVGQLAGPAQLGPNGVILFTLDLSGGQPNGGALGLTIDVTVPQASHKQLFTRFGPPLTIGTPQALQELNSTPLFVEVAGHPTSSTTFEADVALRIFK